MAATGALSASKRSYPTSEVRGRSREDPMPKGQWPRGVTPLPRSGAAAKSSRLPQGRNSREELPKSEVRGGNERRNHPMPLSLKPGAVGGRSYPTPPRPRSRAVTGRSNPTPEARGGGREDQPHVQGAVVAQAQEGLEVLSHVEGQEGQQ